MNASFSIDAWYAVVARSRMSSSTRSHQEPKYRLFYSTWKMNAFRTIKIIKNRARPRGCHYIFTLPVFSSFKNTSGDMYSIVPHSFLHVIDVRSPIPIEILKSISFTSSLTSRKLAGFKSLWITPWKTKNNVKKIEYTF